MPIELTKALKNTHSVRDIFLNNWDVFLRTYEGGIRVRNLLLQHSREPEEIFIRRRRRTFYINIVRTILDTYDAFIFNKPPLRSQEKLKEGGLAQNSEELTLFYKNVDGRGNDINAFMKNEVNKRRNIFGHVYIVVDMPNITGTDIISEQDRLDNGLRPYLYTIDPIRMLNWGMDKYGKFEWVRWEEEIPDESDPFSLSDNSKEKRQRFRTWTKQEWFLHEIVGDEVKVVDQGVNPLNEVPVILVKHRDSTIDSTVGLSAINDLSWMNIAIYQWTSLLDEELYNKVMSLLAVQQDVGDERPEFEISSNNVLTYSGQAPPTFISPSIGPTQVILQAIDHVKIEMFNLAKLGTTRDVRSSGIAKAFDFNETNQVLQEQAASLEDAEQEIHRLWGIWMNQIWDGVIDYPDDFGVEVFDEELKVLTDSIATIKSTTFSKLMQTRVAVKMLHKESSEVKATIASEIEEETNNELALRRLALQRQAEELVGRTSSDQNQQTQNQQDQNIEEPNQFDTSVTMS